MTHTLDSLGSWFADYYLLSTILLLLATMAIKFTRQPVHRLAIVKSTLVALALLAGLSALPGWSIIHLLTAERPAAPAATTLEPIPAAPTNAKQFIPQTTDPTLPPRTASRQPPQVIVPPSAAKWNLSWRSTLAIVQLTGACVVITWLTIGALAAARLRLSATPAPPHITTLLANLLASRRNAPTWPRLSDLGFAVAKTRTIPIATSHQIDVPVALGVFRPAILLPASWLQTLPLPFREGPGEGSAHSPLPTPHSTLAPILAHELAHITNHDLLWLAASRAHLILLWSQPLFWLARRRLRLDQEALADAAAAEVTSRQEYAEQLVAWARDVRSRPALHLSSAVGLWEGPSQLRERIAILLNERLTVLRDCSRKWRLAAAGLSVFAAFMLSLVTLQPATQAEEKPPTKTASSELPVSADPMKLGDRFILCPVTTDLQRSLLGDVDQPMSKVSLCVFVNGAELKDEPIEAGSSFFAGLAEKLSAHAKSGNDLVTFRILLASPGQARYEAVDKRLKALTKLCEALAKDAGFKRARTSQTFFNSDFDWSKYVAAAESVIEQTKSSGVTLGEKSIGDDRVRVFAVSTFLSRMLAEDTDCVVNIKPIIRARDGSRFPVDFTESMQEFIPKLKYARNKTMLARVRFAEPEKESLDRWVNDRDGRHAFARKFGFENCNLQQSQVAAEDVEKLEREESAAEKAANHAQEERSTPNTITGRVVDEKGQPTAGAEALLFRVNRIDGERKLQTKTTTDAKGNYRFENVVDIPKEYPGRKFNPQNHAFDPREEELVQVVVRAPDRVAGVQGDLRQRIALTGEIFNMVLKPSATLTGRVIGPAGKPIGGALVMVGGLNSSTWEGVASAQTKPDGTYEISDAAPYGVDEFQKLVAERQRQRQSQIDQKKEVFLAYIAPPVMTVAHRDFATKNVIYQKIPGKQDVTLEPGAVLEGQVIYGDSAKPAAGVIVHLATPQPRDNQPGQDHLTPDPVALDARTDINGKYTFKSLPAGSYNLFAEMPGWVNILMSEVTATASKTSTVPSLVLSKGGVISVCFVDDKTGEPIPVTPGMRADITADIILPNSIEHSRPNWDPSVAANSAGRFELHAAPGKQAVRVNQVSEDGELRWFAKPSAKPVSAATPINGELRRIPKVYIPQRTIVDVVDGKTVEVDLRVVDQDPNANWKETTTPLFGVSPRISESGDNDKAQKKNPKTKGSPADEQKQPVQPKISGGATPSPHKDRDDEGGSQMLRDIRAASAPLLAEMVEKYGYALKPGADLVRIAPPFATIRMKYYRTGNPTQANAIPAGPSAMIFGWANGKLKSPGMTFGDPATGGYTLTDLADQLVGIKTQQIDGPNNLLRKSIPGDWVVRDGADPEAVAAQLQQILRDELSLPVSLKLKVVERPVYIVHGTYHLTPLPGHEAEGKLILTDETLTTDKIEIFGKELVTNSGSGGGCGNFETFLSWLGRWIGTPIVSEVKSPPERTICFQLHGHSPSTPQTERDDHDPKLVLANITAQTGLEFVKENRPVKILFVEPLNP